MTNNRTRKKHDRNKYTVPKINGMWPIKGTIDPSLKDINAWNHPASLAWRKWISDMLIIEHPLVLLTPCSNNKPYPKSPMSRKIRGVLKRLNLWNPSGNGLAGSPYNLAWLYVSDLLGLVPYERSHEYPACCYEFPPSILSKNNVLLEEIRNILQGFFSRNKKIEIVISFLPRLYRYIVEPVLSDFDWLNIKWVKYDIFYGHRNLASVMREVINTGL